MNLCKVLTAMSAETTCSIKDEKPSMFLILFHLRETVTALQRPPCKAGWQRASVNDHRTRLDPCLDPGPQIYQRVDFGESCNQIISVWNASSVITAQ